MRVTYSIAKLSGGFQGPGKGRELSPGTWIAVWGGVACEVQQRYFLARVPAFEIDTSGFEQFEKARVTGRPKNWRRPRMCCGRPAGLPQLLAQLLADGPPDQPITVDG